MPFFTAEFPSAPQATEHFVALMGFFPLAIEGGVVTTGAFTSGKLTRRGNIADSRVDPQPVDERNSFGNFRIVQRRLVDPRSPSFHRLVAGDTTGYVRYTVRARKSASTRVSSRVFSRTRERATVSLSLSYPDTTVVSPAWSFPSRGDWRAGVIYRFARFSGEGANIRGMEAHRRVKEEAERARAREVGKNEAIGGKVREPAGGELAGGGGGILALDFIMQPLKVGVTPIGRKYELRLAEIARRTLLYLHTTLQ